MKLIDLTGAREAAVRQSIPCSKAGGKFPGLEIGLFAPGRDALVLRAPTDFSRTDWRGFRTLAVEIANLDADEVKIEVALAGTPGETDRWKTATFTALIAPKTRATWRIPLQQLRYSATWGSPWGWPRQKGLGCLESTGLLDTKRVAEIRIGFTAMPRTGRVGSAGVEDPKWAAPVRVGLYRVSLEDPIKPKRWIDRYGQSPAFDWPTKVKADSDITRADRKEAAGLAKYRPVPDRDRYQAWTGRNARRAAGFFRVESVDGRWWLIAPNGRLYYATGMDCVICGVDGRLDKAVLAAHSWFPPRTGDMEKSWHRRDGKEINGLSLYRANLIRKWGPDFRRRYLDRAVARQLAWGFSSIGNWSDHDLSKYRMLPYFSVGPSYAGMKTPYVAKLIHDAFDPGFAADAKKAAAGLASYRNDRMLVGHFLSSAWALNSEYATGCG